MRYSAAFQRQLEYAAYDCAQAGVDTIEVDHLLLGLYRADFPLIDEVFATFRVDSLALLDRLLKDHPDAPRPGSADRVQMSPEAVRAVAAAEREAERLGHDVLTPPHTLIGILDHERDRLQRYFIRHDIVFRREDEVLRQVRELVNWLRFSAGGDTDREIEMIGRTIVGMESVRLRGKKSKRDRGYAVQVRLLKRFSRSAGD